MIQLGDFEYDPRDHLGRGQFGSVYKGHFITKPSKQVAIKFIENSRDSPLSFVLKREIALLTVLRHPNIVKLYAYYINHKQTGIYLIMEMCNGGDLSKYLSAKRPLPISSIRIIAHQVALALNEMNKYKVIHRDLKPANIMVCHCKNCGKRSTDLPVEQLTFKIGDFGLARELKRDEMAATVCGSPVYMAPEIHLKKPYDSKVDMWSLGAIMYECLTGKVPYRTESLYAMVELFRKNPGLKPGFPNGTDPQLGQLLTKMLAYHPRERPDFAYLLEHPFFAKMNSPNYRKVEKAPVPSQQNFNNPMPSTSKDVMPKFIRPSKDDSLDIWPYAEPNIVEVPSNGLPELPTMPMPTRVRSSSLDRGRAKHLDLRVKVKKDSSSNGYPMWASQKSFRPYIVVHHGYPIEPQTESSCHSTRMVILEGLGSQFIKGGAEASGHSLQQFLVDGETPNSLELKVRIGRRSKDDAYDGRIYGDAYKLHASDIGFIMPPPKPTHSGAEHPSREEVHYRKIRPTPEANNKSNDVLMLKKCGTPKPKRHVPKSEVCKPFVPDCAYKCKKNCCK